MDGYIAYGDLKPAYGQNVHVKFKDVKPMFCTYEKVEGYDVWKAGDVYITPFDTDLWFDPNNTLGIRKERAIDIINQIKQETLNVKDIIALDFAIECIKNN